MGGDFRRARQEALVRALEAEGLDALLVTARANIRYLTGFSGSAALVVVTRADVLLVTDFRYDEQARDEAGAVARIEVESTSVWERLFRELPSLGTLGWIGYEAHALTVKDADRFATVGKLWHWKATADLVERLRVSKDPAEVAAIKSAASLATEALGRTLATVAPGMTELEIAGTLEAALRRLGSEGHPFPTIVASGPRTRAAARAIVVAAGSGRGVAATRLRRSSRRLLRGRHAHGRRGPARGRPAAGALRACAGGAVASARGGERRDAGPRRGRARPRRDRESRLRGGAFGHSLGHGLGLEVHEAPRLSRTNAEPLPAEAVVTIEPGVYIAGQGGVRIEDDVHLSRGGPVLLSDGLTELVELV